MKVGFKHEFYQNFLLSVLLPTLVFSLLFVGIYTSRVIRQYYKDSLSMLGSVSDRVGSLSTSMLTMLTSTYLHQELYTGLQHFASEKEERSQVEVNNLESDYVAMVYKLLLGSEQGYEALTFFPLEARNHQCEVVSRNSAGLKVVDFDYADLPWYTEALSQHEPVFFFTDHVPPYLPYVNDFPVASACMRIKDPYTKRVFGVIRLDLRASRFEELLSSSDGDYFSVDDQDGGMIASPGSVPLKRESVLQTEIDNTGWVLSYHRDGSFLTRTIVIGIALTFGYLVLTLALSLLFYRRRTRKVVSAIDHILLTIKEYQKGNFKSRAARSDEPYVGDCIDALNEMGERTERLIRQEYLSTIRRQEAEFQALQAQINPHFLYNTLNGMIALNRMGEVERLEEGLVTLSALFRYTCSSKAVVTVKEECAFLHQYLVLQKEKYEDRLSWQFTIREDAERMIIPKLLVQPLVENAVLHGLEPVEREVTISVEAEKTDEFLILTVCDNGKGCTLAELMQGFHNQENKHIALKNVCSRLCLFAPHSRYHLYAEPNKGVKVVLELNLKEERS